ncbi:site-specific integrase [Nonomuraea pusilla]|uniref:Phage integrase family protein n=1 Tax=Nonomuraea pusilla TaxID=46177 RepID=A0A1H8DP53_9ACTN|nr:site-specific integrase [Nonomuraea pusilla]SEN08935.1 Phage integrase family protein [Nonomuraea pusilla]
MLLLLYGLRRGEALGLRWIDVDFEDGHVDIRRQLVRVGTELLHGPVKTKAGKRSLPLLGIVREALEIQRDGQKILREEAGENWVDTGLVFTTRSGRPIEPRNLARSFARIVEQNELRPIRVHDLRHTAASLLKKLGVAPRDAMEILGHSRISVTMEIYTHGDGESREDALRKVTGLFE